MTEGQHQQSSLWLSSNTKPKISTADVNAIIHGMDPLNKKNNKNKRIPKKTHQNDLYKQRVSASSAERVIGDEVIITAPTPSWFEETEQYNEQAIECIANLIQT
jgi:hypothetical protein